MIISRLILENIQKYLFFWISGAVLTGLSWVYFFEGISFSPLICLLAAFLMIYPSLVPLPFEKLRESLANYRVIIISLAFNFIFAPGLAIGIGYIFLQENPALWVGLIILSILPGGGMVTTWALKSKADMPATISIVIFNLVAAILIAPFVLSEALIRLESQLQDVYMQGDVCAVSSLTGGFMSCSVGEGVFSPFDIAIPVIFIIVFPLILAFVTQFIIKKKRGLDYFERIKSDFGGFSNLGLIIIIFILMSLNSNSIIFDNPALIFEAVLPLALFYVAILGSVLIIYVKFFKNSVGKALVWGSYLRYITLGLGLSISLIFQNVFLSTITVIILLAYFIQIPSSFWLARYLDKK